jgi:hypothetical protein
MRRTGDDLGMTQDRGLGGNGAPGSAPREESSDAGSDLQIDIEVDAGEWADAQGLDAEAFQAIEVTWFARTRAWLARHRALTLAMSAATGVVVIAAVGVYLARRSR